MDYPRQTYPLTFSQLLAWEGEIVAASHLNLCALVKLEDAGDIECWRQAIRLVVRENEGLRMHMILQGGDVRQYVAPDPPVEVPFLDFSLAGREAALREWVEREVRLRFPMVDSPLFSFAILRLNSQDHRLFLKVHHLVSDGWSMTVLSEKILQRYRLLQAGESAPTKPDGAFVEYILQQTASRMLDKARLFLSYAFEKVTSAPPAVRIRPGLPAGGSNVARLQTFTLPSPIQGEIARFNEASHTSAYLFFLSSILLEIALANAAEEAAIGTLFHNRLNPATQNSIGLFNVILPLRFKVGDQLSFRDLVKRVLAGWKSAIQRQPGRVSLQELTILVQHVDQLFDVLVSYESRLPVEPPEWLHGEADLEPISLMITILDYPSGGFDIEFLYRTEQYRPADIEEIYQALLDLWGKLLAEPEGRIGELRENR